MSIAQEFADDIERRRRRVARQQFWFNVRVACCANRDFWTCVLVLAAAGALGVLLAVLLNP
jgi:hypothetical protein